MRIREIRIGEDSCFPKLRRSPSPVYRRLVYGQTLCLETAEVLADGHCSDTEPDSHRFRANWSLSLQKLEHG